VLLLLDGKRSVAQVAHLTQRSELDVASTLARFLHLGYIEPVNTPFHRVKPTLASQ
jgi:hypothetical protein